MEIFREKVIRMETYTNRRSVLLAALALALAATACHKHGSDAEEPYRMQPAIRMSDPRAQMQLVSGFYGMESGAWRWTKQRFSAVLRPPDAAAQKGAELSLRLTVPDVVISKLKSVTLTGSINGRALPPETYDHAGTYAYTREVPADLLAGESVTVEFQLDKVMPPAPPDLRELGVVALSISLNSK
jgi:hypothetical protein